MGFCGHSHFPLHKNRVVAIGSSGGDPVTCLFSPSTWKKKESTYGFNDENIFFFYKIEVMVWKNVTWIKVNGFFLSPSNFPIVFLTKLKYLTRVSKFMCGGILSLPHRNPFLLTCVHKGMLLCLIWVIRFWKVVCFFNQLFHLDWLFSMQWNDKVLHDLSPWLVECFLKMFFLVCNTGWCHQNLFVIKCFH